MRILYNVIILFCFCSISLSAQTLEELNAQKAELSGKIGELQGQLGAVQGKIDAMPGWFKGSFGTIGVNLTNFNNWVNTANPNSRNTSILASMTGYANNIRDKFFWRNRGAINLGWQKLVENTADAGQTDKPFSQVADNFNISSLYGRRINSKFAISALGEYRTTLLNKFNNPGYLDLGAGATWTPINNMVVVFHPLNYNFIFAKDNAAFTSSMGCKIVADYTAKIAGKLNWRSNLSSFLSYKSLGDLSNHTWTNGISFTAWKGIGVGIEHAIRLNKQETKALIPVNNTQQYYIIGLTYNI